MMKCDNCPFAKYVCEVGGEGMLMDDDECPLYRAIAEKFDQKNA